MRVEVRQMEERDLPETDRIIRLAFGTFLGIPDPIATFGDSDYAYTRFRAAPDAAIVAEVDGKLAGSNFATQWGSFGFFGPLTVDPALWNKGAAQVLLKRTMELFERWDCRHTGLFTFSNSPKHAALYQKFDYWPQYLTPVMSKDVNSGATSHTWLAVSELRPVQKEQVLADCRDLTGSIHEGLDLTREIRAVDKQRLGDTLLMLDGSTVTAFAVCHAGPGTEAGSHACYVKFGAVRPGSSAQANFERLLKLCESWASTQLAQKLIAGVNMARHEAYRTMIGLGFRADLIGVALQKGNAQGFNRPGVYVIDDWR